MDFENHVLHSFYGDSVRRISDSSNTPPRRVASSKSPPSVSAQRSISPMHAYTATNVEQEQVTKRSSRFDVVMSSSPPRGRAARRDVDDGTATLMQAAARCPLPHRSALLQCSVAISPTIASKRQCATLGTVAPRSHIQPSPLSGPCHQAQATHVRRGDLPGCPRGSPRRVCLRVQAAASL